MTNIKRETTKQKSFTYVSLFSGIGGFEQALNKFESTCVFASEFDKYAQQSYTALYGDDNLHGDITKIDEKDVPECDLLVGGFPCQAFSVAGKRKGFSDARGTLFFDIARIANEKKPKTLLLENVKGLVNHDKGNTLDTMIRILNDIGYVIDFSVLNSKYFGVPQNRERIFIVAIREDLIKIEPFNEESIKGNTIVPKSKRRINEWAKTFNFNWPQNDEVTTRLRDILEYEVDEKYYISEERTAKLMAQLKEIEIMNEYTRDKNARIQFIGNINPSEQGISGNVYDVEAGLYPTLVAGSKAKILEENRIRDLTPLECWRLQGFPDEAYETVKQIDLSDNQLYKQAGNAVTVNVVEAIVEQLIPFIVIP